MSATCFFRVLRGRRFPLAAAAGDYLAVMPPTFADNLWVLEPVDLWVVRRGHFPEGKLWTLLAHAIESGELMLHSSPAAELLPYLLQAGELSPRQALRVLRRRAS